MCSRFLPQMRLVSLSIIVVVILMMTIGGWNASVYTKT